MNKNDIRYLIGNDNLTLKPLPIYSDIVCDFLDDLSKALRNETKAKIYPDIMTFAFWCRKSNILRLKQNYHTDYLQVGKGLVFHIAPSNVPINFAFSLVFGMLAGNGNVVRVSEKDFPQVNIVCSVMSNILKHEKYAVIRNQTQVVSYGHSREINDYYSAMCDSRVIWGGDSTIANLRQSQIKPRCTEITFADRYSFAIFNETAINELLDEELKKVCEKFYNDTYLMDQNACSSPHLIMWTQADGQKSGRSRFWNMLLTILERYDFPDKKALDKFSLLCEKASAGGLESVKMYSNLLYVVRVGTLCEDVDKLRGIFGLFYETELDDISELHTDISNKVQTCVTYGVDKEKVVKAVVDKSIRGIDRVVDVGQAMDIGVYWDGYDVIGQLSRKIIIG